MPQALSVTATRPTPNYNPLGKKWIHWPVQSARIVPEIASLAPTWQDVYAKLPGEAYI